MATAPARNYRRNPHTARLLMAFHTAGGASIDAPETDTYEVPAHTGGSDGMVTVNRREADVEDTGHGFGETCNNSACCPPAKPVRSDRGLPTEKQREFIGNLLADLKPLDHAVWTEAMEYTCRMSGARAWDPSRGGNVSRWIDHLKAKIDELRTAAPVEAAPVVTGALPVKLDKNGKPMPLRYAVEMDGVLKFYRIKPGFKPGFYFIDVQASDDLHSIRNRGTKDAIVAAIIAAGPEACMARYGQELGECGRCGKTLTDADSRARGIGPDCLGKM